MDKCLKVNYCAAPSSYKSTVCVGVEALLKQEGIVTDTSKEYVREYINAYGFPREMYEQLIITDRQNSRDEEIARVSQIMLSDAPAVNGYIFGRRKVRDKLKKEKRTIMTPAELHYLEVLHQKTLRKLEWYDIIIVFPPFDQLVSDGTRQESMEDKQEIYKAIEGFLHVENVPFHYINGTSQERIQKSFEIIKKEYHRRQKYNELKIENEIKTTKKTSEQNQIKKQA